MTTRSVTRCARNLPQHFNGCACVRGAASTQGAVDVTLVETSGPRDETVAWEEMVLAETDLQVARSRHGDEERSLPFPWRKKRIETATAQVQETVQRLDDARQRHAHAHERLTNQHTTTPEAEAGRALDTAHAHAMSVRKMVSRRAGERDSATTAAERKDADRALRHLTHVYSDAQRDVRHATADYDDARAAIAS